MSVEVRDKMLLEIIDPNHSLEVVAEGFTFTEGPIWHPQEHHLTFSDIPANRMHRWSASKGLSIYREPSNMANGNTYDRQGKMLTCEHATHRVVRQESDGQLTVLASHYQSKELNSPNDIVVRSNGDIYFTDPVYGRYAGFGLERPRELDFQGIYKIEATSGELTLLNKQLTQPNGLAFSPDESTLYVADTPEMHIWKFEVADDGSLANGRVFSGSTGTGAGAPDGLKVAANGYVFCAGPGGVHMYEPVQGTDLGVIRTPAFCANFTWGGEDLLTFFLTSSNRLYQIPVKLPGIPLI